MNIVPAFSGPSATTNRREALRILRVCLFTATVAASVAAAQQGPVWRVSAQAGTVATSYTVGQLVPGAPAPVSGSDQADTLSPGEPGQRKVLANARLGLRVFTCPTKAGGFARITVQGEGTPVLRIGWYANAQTAHECDDGAGMALASSYLNTAVQLYVKDTAAHGDVAVYYAWAHRSFSWSRAPGSATVRRAQLAYGRTNLFDSAGRFDITGNNDLRASNQGGSMYVPAGLWRPLYVGAICEAGQAGPVPFGTVAQALVYGEIVLSLAGPVGADALSADTVHVADTADAVAGVADAAAGQGVADRASAGITSAPNPFSTTTTIAFTTARPAAVTLVLYDARGVYVRTLADRAMPAGRHGVAWDGTAANGEPVPAGTYFSRMTAAGHDGRVQQATGRVVVVRP